MTTSIDQVKELRESTGVSIMQCKKALEECGGDMEKALMLLKTKASVDAAKKGDRATTEGLVVAKSANGKAVMLTLYCETDFVARNEDFVALANSLLDIALESGIEKVKESAKEHIDLVVQKIGENIQLGNVEEIAGESLGVYTHNGKMGVVISLAGGNAEMARDIAMHVAAMKPEFVSGTDIPEEQKVKAKELFEKEVNESDKPEEIKAKMLQGKIDTYFKELTLLDQPYVKDGSMTVGKLLENAKSSVTGMLRQSI